MRKVLCILIISFLIIFTSCASQENGGNTRQTDGSDKVPVSQIWDGYEEMQGADLGVIKLPESISPATGNEYYSFTLSPYEQRDYEDDSKNFFKAFFGESYSDSFVHKTDAASFEYEDENGGTSYFVNGIPVNYYNAERVFTGGSITQVIKRLTNEDTNEVLELEGGSCTVEELCSGLGELIAKAFYPLYDGFEIYPKYIILVSDREQKKSAEVTCALRYKGVEMQCLFSSLFEEHSESDHESVTSYTPSNMVFYMESKDSILMYSNRAAIGEVKEERLTELIPLSAAAELLKAELAPGHKYEIETVELQYCHKATSPVLTNDSEENSRLIESYRSKGASPFVPTWCFGWTAETENGLENKYIKVNAVTGEITMDM